MAMVPGWTEITVDEELLPAVIRDLLALADDPSNDVDISFSGNGRVIKAKTPLAEAWFDAVNKKNEEDDFAQSFEAVANEEIEEAKVASQVTDELTQPESLGMVPIPIKRGPGRPRKVQTPPLSDGEERAS